MRLRLSLIEVITVTTSPSRTSRYRPWLVAAVASSAVLGPAFVAAAQTWQNSSATLIQFQHTCRDGIRFGGAVSKDATIPDGPFEGTAVVVQPPPPGWDNWKPDRVGEKMHTAIAIPLAPENKTVPTDNGPEPVTRIGAFTLPYRNGPLEGLVALNLEDGPDGATVNTDKVTDCFLYAPIDVQPGKSPNKVPIGHGEVSVAALTTDLMRADQLKPKKFRLGPGKAAPKGSELRDVNRDKRPDMVMRFGSTAAGLTCSTKSVKLTGKSPSGGVFEGLDKVVPDGC
jgi:hypothetical protein